MTTDRNRAPTHYELDEDEESVEASRAWADLVELRARGEAPQLH